MRQVTVDRSGTVYVLDPEAEGIHVFDAAGPYRGLIGRAGSGPGEFRNTGWSGWLGDTLWVTDPALRRVTFFRTDGTVVRIDPAPQIASSKTRLPFSLERCCQAVARF